MILLMFCLFYVVEVYMFVNIINFYKDLFINYEKEF